MDTRPATMQQMCSGSVACLQPGDTDLAARITINSGKGAVGQARDGTGGGTAGPCAGAGFDSRAAPVKQSRVSRVVSPP